MKKVVVSIGNPIKGDDNIANIVLAGLGGSRGLLLLEGGPNPENTVPKIRAFGPDRIYFLDAVDFRSEPGEVRLFTLDKLDGTSISSTHNIPLGLFSKLFPKARILVIGIQPKTLGFREKLSPELEGRVRKITERVRGLLD